MKILAIIPARSGSKGIKNKNLKKFLGKPLISYSLETLKKLKKIVYPFVSTDSFKILKYAKNFGFSDNYLRPKKLSRDNSNVIDAVFDAIKWLENKKIFFDYILLLEPTSPNRNNKRLKDIINYVIKNDIDSATSVCELPFHPSESVFIKNKNWKFIIKNNNRVFQRQQFKKNYFFIDGNFYLSKINFLKKYKKFVVENKTCLFQNNSLYPIDINNYLDFKIAELIVKYEKK